MSAPIIKHLVGDSKAEDIATAPVLSDISVASGRSYILTRDERWVGNVRDTKWQPHSTSHSTPEHHYTDIYILIENLTEGSHTITMVFFGALSTQH